MPQPDWIALYLQEDLDEAGDVTSDAVFGPEEPGRARIVARERCFLAGVARAADVFGRLGCRTEVHMNDGSWVDEGASVLAVSGPARGLLAAERTALNVLGRMSGIATRARRLAEALGAACSGAVVAGTRKTTPGFRAFEKEALRIAGADPHRMGLYDEAMVKDNHRAALGDVAEAVRRVRAAHPDVVVTAEVESLQDALAAAAAGADWLLIDNQTPATGKGWAEAVWKEHPGLRIEASGGITEEGLLDYAWADRISLGSLTTRAVSADFSLEWEGP